MTAAGPAAAPAVEPSPRAAPAVEPPWRRLDPKLIWADGLRAVLSMLPGVLTMVFLDAGGTMVTWPLLVLAGWGLWGALVDLVRWLTTRYRLTETHLECRAGLLVRSSRSVARERIRTVDVDARLIHRVAGVRRVTIGAGQTSTAMEAALVLDALSRDAAERLRRELTGAPEEEPTAEAREPALAEFDRRWVVYNLFGIWALVCAGGLLFGAQVTLGAFGVDLVGWFRSAVDAWQLGAVGAFGFGFALVVVVGAVGMGTQFFTSQAFFRLTREPGEHGGSVLRTRRGLFRTREAVRDEARTRGATISEPLLWRWLGTTDTSLITTGVFWWSEGVTLLPRGPRRAALRVAAAVLGDDPLTAPLTRHPAAALRRRLVWALWVAAAAALAVAPLGRPAWAVALGVVGPLALGLAFAGYRSLGHAVTDDYLVLRAGAMTRSTSALRRTAVSGVCIRQSPLQRRLGLATVRVSTAAGEGSYAARDLAVAEALPLAVSALPVVTTFREGGSVPGPRIGSGRPAP
ncbi:PH domain-containing protein [Streptomyces sp. DSM 44915]|uniref:PH domain-containing protein n=1 Tax=Streptomyces chisholmiae TaxID=3075540 RepID=A0ABU2JKZ8_9ACTN|nr:PH domain-containing protein [Streptomyces sp. DSM 44915]MDT0265374.1 PH domain-containing protein [Streptomyces sp. DSM 44915]